MNPPAIIYQCPASNLLAISAACAGTAFVEDPQIKPRPEFIRFEWNASSPAQRLPDTQDGSVNVARSPHVEVAEALRETFCSHGIAPDRMQKSAENVLIEFMNGRDACVDVHVNGEIVVIVNEDGVDNVFELGIDDVELVIGLVRDGIKG